MKSDRGPVIASLSVIGGVLATISCCLPLPGLALAAGLAGASALLQEIRPLLIGLSLCALAIAFVLAYRKRACSTTSRVSVWIALAVLLVSLVFPEKVANVIAGSAPRGTAVAK
ncbi:MAG TPA: hypothetical protein VE621_06435, partial [Bryobacteraceae bacterium]|nr:hypothetical protein [Bryobacteraceae bacterium]